MKIAIVIPTIDRSPNPNYLFQTLENLERAGVFAHPALHSIHLVDSGSERPWPTPGNGLLQSSKVWVHERSHTHRRSAKLNCAAALSIGAASGADWVLQMEDDLDVCADFLGSVHLWLSRFGRDDRPNVFAGHQEGFFSAEPRWDYPVKMFWGMQCVAMRPVVAESIACWFENDGNPESHNDIELHNWADANGIDVLPAAAPSFVQHIGAVTSFERNPYGGGRITFPSWRGADWTFQPPKPRLLWVGDAGVPSGFAKATHEILDSVKEQFDVTVLGINYRGDPHTYPYDIFAASPGGDYLGIGRLVWMCDFKKPQIVVLQNDGWNIPAYVQQLRRFPEYNNVPIVAIVAVDGKNFRKEWLAGVAHTIFWTQFALDEARAAGFTGAASIIPLGVDRSVYFPRDRRDSRLRRLANAFDDKFIVGVINRNQPRKRWDLTLEYFAEWVREFDVANAHLFLHTAPTGDTGINIKQLAEYYGITDRMIVVQPPTWYGVDEDTLAVTYNCFDVALSTSQGEGFGLTTLEAMACGIPTIVPAWSALGDWPRGGVWQVPCSSTAIGPPYVNVIGGVPDKAATVAALDNLYRSKILRADYGALALAKAQDAAYGWKNIGRQYCELLAEVVDKTQFVMHHSV